MNMKRALRESVKNLVRNPVMTVATISVIAIMLFMLNTLLAAHMLARDAIENLSQKIDLVIFLRDDANEETIEDMARNIKTIAGVKEVVFTSKTEALEELSKSYPETAAFFKKYPLGNPLPASLRIVTDDPSLHPAIRTYVKTDYPHLTASPPSNDSPDAAQELTHIRGFTRTTIFLLIATFIIAGALITSNAIHVSVYTRKMEIAVMRLVGATTTTIVLPFVLEGVYYGFFASLISALLFASLVVPYPLLQSGMSLWPAIMLESFIAMILSGGASYAAAVRHCKG